ncbi:GNAT family N-acetyltransferase [Metabacillus halosaccharovorans]|uniref:GNAT family N-acetyltransferase n=1 Tax=Metabacillus halosaccharovorans TaxID=930124 RepID=UPI00203B6F9D|nr:GNAT family N-acetyltransferase [Metabacillus halosaccharovorans]MCM3443448.1 GNAT family N-acetyltransferase [Metabacillus halosaccharovorans]
MLDSEQTTWINNDGFSISINKRFLDIELIYHFLSNESYWVKGMAKELVETSIESSILCYGVYEGNPNNGPAKQVGFARVVSDLVRFSWLGDVFIIPEYRGRGLSKWLLHVITEHPKLKGTSFQLATKDAHSLYSQFGFKPLGQIENRMARPLNLEVVYKGYKLSI